MRLAAEPAEGVLDWLERTGWFWSVVGGFYLVAYLFWYLPALLRLPGSLREPPEGLPRHWPLDFVVSGLAGAVLVFLGLRRATALSSDSVGDEAHR